MLFVPPSIPVEAYHVPDHTPTSDYTFKKYTDYDGRFSIEFPDDWTIYTAGTEFPMQQSKSYKNLARSIGFYDAPFWKTTVQVFEHERDSWKWNGFNYILDISETDSEVLESVALLEKTLCEIETFEDGARRCLGNGVQSGTYSATVDSYIFYTNDNKKVYIVKSSYSIGWWNMQSVRPVISISGVIYGENNIWEIMAETTSISGSSPNEHDDAIMHMIKSFSVEPTSTTHSTVLTLDLIPSKLKVGDNIRFSGTLKTTDGIYLVQGANITIKSTKLGVLYTIQTDNNGKFATNFKVPIGWSGLSHELFVIYDDSCDYSVFACSDYNHKTGKYDNYNSKSQLHSLTISSTPTLTPEPTPEPTTTSASFKKYTDDDKRFTIEYPDDWVLADSHPDGIVAIDDQYDWRTDFQVFLNEDDSLDNRSDSKVLRAIETNQWELCDEYTFGADGRKCSDFKVVDSYTTETNDGKKIYFIKMTFTLEWEDYLPGQENSMIKTLGLIYDGDTSWEMAVESFEGVFDNNYGNIIYMMKSFSLEPTSTTPTPTPTKSATAVPGWIKNNAEWWADGVIDDSSFLQGIQYLINEKIIVIPPTVTSGSSGSQEVPGWIKNNAEWWADGVIDDNTFVSGIQYLVKVGIIQVG